MGDASVHMAVEHPTGLAGISRQRALEQDSMFAGGNLAPEDNRHHLVPEVLIEHSAIEVEESLGAAGLDQRLVELAIVPLPELCPVPVPRHHAPLHEGE